jgi:protease I
MNKALHGKRYAFLADNGFEESELIEPLQALQDCGATVEVVSPQARDIQGMRHDKPGKKVRVDVPLNRARPEAYDGLVLPGGVRNSAALRINQQAISFIKAFVDAGKPIATICHGPWPLIAASAVRGRTMTSWPSLKTDLCDAGATWVDQEVVCDGTLVTSRRPRDLPAFCKKMIEVFQAAVQRDTALQEACE